MATSDERETLLMTITMAGAATTSSRAQILTLAALCDALADEDGRIRAAAADLIESAQTLLTAPAVTDCCSVCMV